jgi:hypothetical protein
MCASTPGYTRSATTSLTIDVEAGRFDFEKDLEELVCSTRMVYVKIDAQGNASPIEERLRASMDQSLGDLTQRF